MIRANNKQDAVKRQIEHSEYHFDNDQISESQGYHQKQRNAVIISIDRKKLGSTWFAFGRLLHTAQEFYAPTNYVTLWLDQVDGGILPTVDEIDPLDELTSSNSQLRSGKLDCPLELLSFKPVLKTPLIPLLLCDSHACMNLDRLAKGEKFANDISAAIKRTRVELENIKDNLAAYEFGRIINDQDGG